MCATMQKLRMGSSFKVYLWDVRGAWAGTTKYNREGSLTLDRAKEKRAAEAALLSQLPLSQSRRQCRGGGAGAGCTGLERGSDCVRGCDCVEGGGGGGLDGRSYITRGGAARGGSK